LRKIKKRILHLLTVYVIKDIVLLGVYIRLAVKDAVISYLVNKAKW
jgi:hypothetical protein